MKNKVYCRLGAHLDNSGVRFSVWAPNARRVSVVGDFNGWNEDANPMSLSAHDGVWTTHVQEAQRGHRYKFRVYHAHDSAFTDKCDPVGFLFEPEASNASIVWDLDFEWHDEGFLKARGSFQAENRPLSIYEMHIGSWQRSSNYRDLAKILPGYLKSLGFTHVEFQPVMEHPFYGSWGYQTTGYFAPTSRYGTPQDFMALIDALHQANIGVILDWSCAHFPDDAYALSYFDGTYLYEHEDPKQRIHPDWGSLIFNYGRYEVRDFLISSALFWLEHYHVDGIRVDAVASMLYLDYSRKDGEWVPNRFGGKENLEAIEFLKALNQAITSEFPHVLCIAEESTCWPRLTTPVELGGLGFSMKWDMGWMHDTLEFFGRDPIHRCYHQDQLLFRYNYAYSEKFVLALSHDEVVHKKQSLVAKMPGDYMQRFANLRCLLAYQFASPGKKLLFMGTELAPWEEWNHEGSLNFDRLSEAAHLGMNRLVRDLNQLYTASPCLYEMEFDENGLHWLDHSDHSNSVMSFVRRANNPEDFLICAFNFTPIPRHNYRIAALEPGIYEEVINTDSHFYGGFGFGNLGSAKSHPIAHQGWPNSLCLVLPPLSGIFLRLNKRIND